MPQTIKRKYGLPWNGYTSSVPAHLAPPDKCVGAGGTGILSKNLYYDPAQGKFYRRPGIATQGGTSGILEDGAGELTVARARKLFALHSPTLEAPSSLITVPSRPDGVA